MRQVYLRDGLGSAVLAPRETSLGSAMLTRGALFILWGKKVPR